MGATWTDELLGKITVAGPGKYVGGELDQWFPERGSQTSSSSFSRQLVRLTRKRKLWGRGSPPAAGDSEVLQGLRTAGAEF